MKITSLEYRWRKGNLRYFAAVCFVLWKHPKLVPHPGVDTPAHALADCTCAGVSQGEDLTLAFQILWIRLLTLIWIAANHRKTSQWWRQLCCDPLRHVPHPKRAGPQRGRYLNTQQVIARPQILALWTFDSLLTDRTGRMQFIFVFYLMLYTLITLVVTMSFLGLGSSGCGDRGSTSCSSSGLQSHPWDEQMPSTQRSSPWWDLLPSSFHSVWTSQL